MTTFEEVLDNRLHNMRATLKAKAGEYATCEDRYHNFHRAAKVLNTTPEKALLGMMVKHLVSVFDLVDATIDGCEESITKDLVDEKVGDAINYLVLLEGLFLQRLEKQEKGGI